ncbi:hypothetical protein EGJ34_17535 [Stenotrophomonas sp. 278]|nr:hypothetical protein EGJ34_17535 [Stenotrophomonas sp. 278]
MAALRQSGMVGDMTTRDGRCIPAMGLLMLLLMPGCGIGSVSPGARWQQQVKENESPKQGIDFRWTVRDAPGPFEKVVGRAQYDVINSGECGYVQPATGTPTGMTTSMEVPLVKISDVEYKGTVFQDLLKDGNYYGRAECRWGLAAVAVVFRATGAADETRFDTLMNRESLIAGDTVEKFYLDRDYPKVERVPAYPAFGESDVNRYVPAFRQATFSASIRSNGEKE